MLRNRLPQLRILVDTHLLACADLIVAMQFDRFRKKWNNVRIECLPVRVLKVVSLYRQRFQQV